MSQKLLNEVSINEMLHMRESGMTNREIAQNLGVSYAYVLKLIGKQPPELTAQFYATRKERGTVVPIGRKSNRTTFDAPNAANLPEPELPAACLTVQNNIMELVSMDTNRTYIVDKSAQTVELVGGFKIDLPTLGNIVAELSAIQRKLNGNSGIALEAW